MFLVSIAVMLVWLYAGWSGGRNVEFSSSLDLVGFAQLKVISGLYLCISWLDYVTLKHLKFNFHPGQLLR